MTARCLQRSAAAFAATLLAVTGTAAAEEAAEAGGAIEEIIGNYIAGYTGGRKKPPARTSFLMYSRFGWPVSRPGWR